MSVLIRDILAGVFILGGMGILMLIGIVGIMKGIREDRERREWNKKNGFK
jgi:hypothetical protein